MAEFVIPEGYGLPLVDLDTDLLPVPTMDAITAAAVPVVVASPELSATIEAVTEPVERSASLAGVRGGSFLRGIGAANESHHYSSQFVNVPSCNTVKRHQAYKSGAQLLRMVFGNNASIEGNALLVPITVRAAFDNNTVKVPVYFNGARDVTIPVGMYVLSDPVVVDVAADKLFFTRTFVTSSNSLHIPNVGSANVLNGGVGEGCDAANGVTATDKTLTGTVTTNYVSWYGPTLITTSAIGDEPFVSINGDSVANGDGDVNPVTAGRGFIRRALNNSIPYVASAVSGSRLTDARGNRRLLLAGTSTAICESGINDVSGSTVAQIKAQMLAEWTFHKNIGVKRVFQTTMLPRTTSTDNWATVVNQSVDANSPKRIELNDWIRAGAPIVGGAGVTPGTTGAILAGQTGHPLYGYFETADTVESSRNSGKWTVGLVHLTDAQGVHPNAAGHAAVAAAINTALIV